MRKSLELRLAYREEIKSELAQRTAKHQAKIAAMKAARTAAVAAGAVLPAEPLVLLAHGDSWFDYPLDDHDLPTGDFDIIAQLESMGNVNPVIHNISHYGDATTEEMSLPKQQNIIASLTTPANWMNGKPDAILFSGGGDDIAGNQFCIFLDYASAGGSGLDTGRFQDVLAMVRGSYQDLFLLRDRNAANVPIFGHCYDFPIPNGSHPLCAGPWLLPSLQFTGWTVAQGAQILHDALVQFRSMLIGLASNPANNFILIDTQDTLVASDWHNELHPYSEGFKKLAARFVDALRAKFGPARI